MADTESDFAIVVARKQMKGIAHSSTALITAALFGESNVAEALIENGADVNETREVPSRFGFAGRQAVRALHVAVAAKHPTMVQLLLDKGASVKGGHPPPCVGLLACFFHPEWLRLTGFKDFGDVLPTLEALQKAGVDVNTIDGSGLTQLHWAASLEDEFVSAREGLVRYLLARGSNVLKHSKVGWTPLHYAAASNSSAETINALLEMRRLEQINDMDHTGQTALHLALGRMSRVSPDVVRALLKAGSDPHFKRNPIARTPINLARGLVANGHIDSLASLGFRDN
jgi:ankyrin repeat protein